MKYEITKSKDLRSTDTSSFIIRDRMYNDPNMLAPETVLQDRYRIVRQLGQGGMGAVYEAVDQRLDATVALKETLFAEEKLRKQFEHEARLLARLHHPALPRVSDHFAEAEGAFLVMQYIPGDDLAEMITRRRGSFPLEQVLLWADQLLDALDYLHTQDPQVIHRDIKPQNLKLSSRGQIILLDFGLAKGQVSDLSRASTSVSIFGYTPNYAPLEQIQGLGTDQRSDIYALAATLYHLATGIKPPDALTRAAALVNGQPDPLASGDQVNPALGRQVAAVLQRAMAQNREQRYSSALEMRNALHAGQEETLAMAADAATVLLPPATTKLEVPVPTGPALTSESTVVHAPPANRGYGKTLAVAAGILLCAGLAFGGFYAYQHRGGAVTSGAAVPNAELKPTPGQVSGSVDSTAGRIDKSQAEAKKPEAGTQSTPKKETPQKEAPARKPEKPAEPKPADDSRRAQAKPQPTAEPKDEDDDDRDTDDRGRRGGRGQGRMPGGIRVRSRPDGARVMITPDGTRIITMPDGTTRVLNPPGQRKRNKP